MIPRVASDEVTIVEPTIGQDSLAVLLDALASQTARPDLIVLVDDRPSPDGPLPTRAGLDIDVVATGGRGPAAARNAGWRRADTEWVAFLDDDVVPPDGWFAALLADLASAGSGVAGSQGRIRVPLAAGRRPTDWERNVAGLERAQWATADLAYRRAALEAVAGFDERFPRAYREDADLGLRIVAAGGRIEQGQRDIVHPVRPAGRWVSVRLQRGNADDVLIRAVHGRE